MLTAKEIQELPHEEVSKRFHALMKANLAIVRSEMNRLLDGIARRLLGQDDGKPLCGRDEEPRPQGRPIPPGEIIWANAQAAMLEAGWESLGCFGSDSEYFRCPWGGWSSILRVEDASQSPEIVRLTGTSFIEFVPRAGATAFPTVVARFTLDPGVIPIK